jgi:hypothetical protein
MTKKILKLVVPNVRFEERTSFLEVMSNTVILNLQDKDKVIIEGFEDRNYLNKFNEIFSSKLRTEERKDEKYLLRLELNEQKLNYTITKNIK